MACITQGMSVVDLFCLNEFHATHLFANKIDGLNILALFYMSLAINDICLNHAHIK